MSLILGDNIEKLKELDDNSLDSVVTDPPYGLSFMNKKWDHDVPSVEFWKEVLRVLKPGGHVLSFGGTRTYHRMAVAIEDAGFEIRDQIMWLYGSGFPKSHNIKKALDKKGEPSEQWDGYGTALKPANEPIVMARKPLSEKTIVDNVLKWGVGCINIDDCRVIPDPGDDQQRVRKGGFYADSDIYSNSEKFKTLTNPAQGRFPANIILDEEAGQALDEQSGQVRSAGAKSKTVQNSTNTDLKFNGKAVGIVGVNNFNDKGGASRFFYCAKASKKERGTENNHPTVKPIKLMEYLIKLVTPTGGTVLDPFMGSGSTGIAAKNLGFEFVGMELNEEYFEIAKRRINEGNTRV